MKLKPAALAALICAGALIVFGILGTLALYFSSGRDFNFSDNWWIGIGDYGPGTSYTIDDTREASLDGITRIAISDVSCPVVLTTGGEQLSAHLAGECVSTGDPIRLEVTASGSTLKVEVKYPGTGIRNSNCTLTVTIPGEYASDLSVNSVSGSVREDNFTNQLNAVSMETTSGSCTLTSARMGEMNFRSVSGDLTADGVIDGGLTVHTTSGDARVSSVSGPVTFSSVSGSADITCDNPGDIDCETTSGNLTLHLPADTGFSLDFSSVSGDVQNDFPITLTSSGKRHIEGTVGDGGIRIKMDSVSGDVTIRKR